MCKVVTIRYKCGHAFDFQLSSCLGNFSKETETPRGQHRKHCRLTPYLRLRVLSRCGDCMRLKEREKCDRKIKKAVEDVSTAMDFLNDPDSDWSAMNGLLAKLDTARKRARTVEQDSEKTMSTARRAFPRKLQTDLLQLRTFTRRARVRGSLLRYHVEIENDVHLNEIGNSLPERVQP